MIITVAFHRNFKHENVDNKKFSVDIDPSESIDNLKTLITMKFTDFDPD